MNDHDLGLIDRETAGPVLLGAIVGGGIVGLASWWFRGHVPEDPTKFLARRGLTPLRGLGDWSYTRRPPYSQRKGRKIRCAKYRIDRGKRRCARFKYV